MVCVLLKDSGGCEVKDTNLPPPLRKLCISPLVFFFSLCFRSPEDDPQRLACLDIGGPSVSPSHTHAVIHTLPSVSHNVYITLAQPTAGNRQQEKTQLTASLCTSIYSTEKKNAAGTDSLTPSWNFPILDVTDKNEHHKNDTYSRHLYSCIT